MERNVTADLLSLRGPVSTRAAGACSAVGVIWSTVGDLIVSRCTRNLRENERKIFGERLGGTH